MPKKTLIYFGIIVFSSEIGINFFLLNLNRKNILDKNVTIKIKNKNK